MFRSLFIILFVFSISASGQFRDQNTEINLRDKMISNETPSLFFGFFNPEKFSMHHSFNMSYTAFGNQGFALGVYTNSMFYELADNLNIQVDASIVNSPYSSLGDKFSEQINGLYLSRAAINYQPFKNMFITMQYSRMPYYNSDYYYNRYDNPFNRRVFNEYDPFGF